MALLNLQNEQVDTTGQANGQGGSVVQRYTQPTAPTATVPPPTPTPTPTAPATDGGLLSLDQFSANRSGNVDEQGIRDSVAQSLQGQIDATNNYYADLVSRQDQVNQNNTGATRATDARSGLLGSDFGNAHAAGQEQANQKATGAIKDEQATKIAAIQGNIDSMAKQEIAAQKAAALGNADAYSKYLSDAQTQASATLKQLASSGTDLSTLDPQQKAYLYKRAGLDPAIGDLVYNSMKPNAAQLNYKYITQADGSTLAIAPDPQHPGQFIQTTIQGASPDIKEILPLITKYPDAGITSQDSLTTAAQKLQNSAIYQKATAMKTPVTKLTGTGGAANGSGPGQSGNTGGFSDSSANFWAQAGSSGVSMNSLIPSLGMGTAAVGAKMAILNRISTNATTLGIDGATFGAMLTDSKAKQSAYKALQDQGSQTQVNEQTAGKYFDTLSGLADKVDSSILKTGAPVLDGWIRNGVVATTGDPNVNNFMTQMTEALTEYAKVMSGQTSGAGVDQAARAAAQGLLSKGFSAATIKSFVNVAKQNMSDRTGAYNSALQGLFGDIQKVQSSSGGLGGTQPTDTTSPTDSSATPNFMTGPDGKQYAKGPDGNYYPQ